MPEYVANLKKRLHRVWEAQKEIISINKKSSMKKYNKNVRPTTYKEGDMVYLRNDGTTVGECSKFRKEYIGPYQVVKVLSEHSIKILNMKNNKILKNPVHIDRLKHVKGQRKIDEEEQELITSGTPSQANETPNEILPSTGGEMENNHEENNTTDELEEETTSDEEQSWNIENEVYEVERLLKVKGMGNNKQYLVKWKKGKEKFKDSWVKASDITPNLIELFHKKFTAAGKLRKEFQRKKVT
jgi:hypothetical protein